MRNSIVETMIGLGVVLLTAFIVWSFYASTSRTSSHNAIVVTAHFERVNGIAKGTDVRVAGVNIGKVRNIQLDKETLTALVSLELENNLKLPEDSKAAIKIEGLMGGKYISIELGSSENFLKSGDSIYNNQSPLDLDTLIGQAIFGKIEK